MIYDCFSFFNELDLLEIRLNVLQPAVDRFILVESAWTHSGKSKPLVYEENKLRFSKFTDKIIHIKLIERPSPPDGLSSAEAKWFLENYQRNAIIRGLSAARPDDVIMVSDLDEIPDPEIVCQLPDKNGITHFHPKNYAFYLNFRDYHSYFSGVGTTALKYKLFCNVKTFAYFPFTTYVPSACNQGPTMTQVRFLDPSRRYYRGWHFSYMGGAEAVHKKFNATADGGTDGCDLIPIAELEQMLKDSHSIFGDNHPYFSEPPALHLPKYLLDNIDRYRHLLLDVSESDFAATRTQRLTTLISEFKKVFVHQYFYPYVGGAKRRIMRAAL